jgi:hypothetical protein
MHARVLRLQCGGSCTIFPTLSVLRRVGVSFNRFLRQMYSSSCDAAIDELHPERHQNHACENSQRAARRWILIHLDAQHNQGDCRTQRCQSGEKGQGQNRNQIFRCHDQMADAVIDRSYAGRDQMRTGVGVP